jgi:transcriptional regulator NrdR family protein
MNCTKCNGKTKVYDSRPNGKTIRRSRECLTCSHREASTETWLSKTQKSKPKKAPRPKLVQNSSPKKKKSATTSAQAITFADTALLTDEQIEELMFSERIQFDEDEL